MLIYKTMEMNDFIGNLRDQFDDLDESIVLTPEMSFRDIDGYSSLVALLIISMFDEEYGVTVTGDDMRKASTVQDLFNLVQSKL